MLKARAIDTLGAVLLIAGIIGLVGYRRRTLSANLNWDRRVMDGASYAFARQA